MFERIAIFLGKNELARSVAIGVSAAIIILLVFGTVSAIVLTFAQSALWVVVAIFCALACGAVGGFISWVIDL